MAQKIEIYDKRPGKTRILVDLVEILVPLEPFGREFRWSIVDLDAWWNKNHGIDINDLQRRINESSCGLVLSWETLVLYSQKIFQVLDTTIVACKDENAFKRKGFKEDPYSNCDIVLVGFDTTFWEVYSKSDDVIHAFKAHFREIKQIE